MTAVTCIGGGHGLAATLRAVRPWASPLTAVVSVADDGGSSGRLRADLGVVPPGDLRRCLNALADPDSTLGEALEHRFTGGDLEEHALGNLLLAGLMEHGLDPVDALDEVGRLVGAAGRVLPASTGPVILSGEGLRDEPVEGQVRVQESSGLRRVCIQPPDPPTPEPVVDAITGADLVTLGPGSLFTSVLAAAIVPGVAGALGNSAATRVLVLNLGPQAGETGDLDPDDHVRIALEHGLRIDVVLADPRFAPTSVDVACEIRRVGDEHAAVHDPDRLGVALRDLVGHRAAAASAHSSIRRSWTKSS